MPLNFKIKDIIIIKFSFMEIPCYLPNQIICSSLMVRPLCYALNASLVAIILIRVYKRRQSLVLSAKNCSFLLAFGTNRFTCIVHNKSYKSPRHLWFVQKPWPPFDALDRVPRELRSSSRTRLPSSNSSFLFVNLLIGKIRLMIIFILSFHLEEFLFH